MVANALIFMLCFIMNNKRQELWIITPQEALAKNIRLYQNANQILNFNSFCKKFYRNTLHGKKLILNNKQQKILIQQFNNNKQTTNSLIRNWQIFNELSNTKISSELIKYQKYLDENQLTDENALWQNIINEMKSCNIRFIFYGFYDLKENTKKLIDAIKEKNPCQFFYPITKNIKTSAIKHQSESDEVTWLQENSKETCLILCQDNSRFLQIATKTNAETSKSTPLASTIIIKQALKILSNHINFKITKHDWLEILQLKFPYDTTLIEWHNSQKSILDHFEAKAMLSEEIYQWLNNINNYKTPQQATFSDWAKHYNNILEIAGWPFVKHPSQEHSQLINFWQSNLTTWAMQDLNNNKFNAETAVKLLIQDCQQVNYRKTINKNSLIKLFTPKEATGMLADKIIVIGANSKFKLDNETQLNTLKRLQNQAKELVFSYSEVVNSELCQVFPPLIEYKILSSANPLNTKPDSYNTPFINQIRHLKSIKITSRMITNQALCPIKNVFSSLTKANNNEISLLRGITVHEVLAWFWQEVRTQKKLLSLTDTELETNISKLLTKSLQKNAKNLALVNNTLTLDVEHEYLKTMIIKYLATEKQRPDFKVVATEASRIIEIAGYKIKVRLDRVDLEEHGYHLIDYKTGDVSPSNWLGEPPKDPQIPLYLSGSKTYVNVSYACLNKNFIGHKGFSSLKNTTWDKFTEMSQASILLLINEITSGISFTRPHNKELCLQCQMMLVCRPDVYY